MGGTSSEVKVFAMWVEERSKPMLGFVLRKEYNGILELNKIIRSIVKFQ